MTTSSLTHKDTEDDFDVSRIEHEEESKDTSTSQGKPQFEENEEDKREIMMEFGGREISGVSPDGRGNNTVSDEDDEDFNDIKETRQD
jgi:hypothetical protein